MRCSRSWWRGGDGEIRGSSTASGAGHELSLAEIMKGDVLLRVILALLCVPYAGGCKCSDGSSWGRVDEVLRYRGFAGNLEASSYAFELSSARDNLQGKLARYCMKDLLVQAVDEGRWAIALELSAVVGTYYSFILVVEEDEEWVCASSLLPGRHGLDERSDDVWVARVAKSRVEARVMSDLLDAPRVPAGVYTFPALVTGGGEALFRTEFHRGRFFQSLDYGFDIPSPDLERGIVSRLPEEGLGQVDAVFSLWRQAYSMPAESRSVMRAGWN